MKQLREYSTQVQRQKPQSSGRDHEGRVGRSLAMMWDAGQTGPEASDGPNAGSFTTSTKHHIFHSPIICPVVKPWDPGEDVT